jgi:hypothetical protein
VIVQQLQQTAGRPDYQAEERTARQRLAEYEELKQSLMLTQVRGENKRSELAEVVAAIARTRDEIEVAIGLQKAQAQVEGAEALRLRDEQYRDAVAQAEASMVSALPDAEWFDHVIAEMADRHKRLVGALSVSPVLRQARHLPERDYESLGAFSRRSAALGDQIIKAVRMALGVELRYRDTPEIRIVPQVENFGRRFVSLAKRVGPDGAAGPAPEDEGDGDE